MTNIINFIKQIVVTFKKNLLILTTFLNAIAFTLIFPFLGKYLSSSLSFSLNDGILYATCAQVFIIALTIDFLKTDMNNFYEENRKTLESIKKIAAESKKSSKQATYFARNMKLLSQDSIDVVKVRIAVFNKFLHYMPLYVAKNMEIFQEEGLAVDIDSKGNDDAAIVSLNKGECDFAITDPMMIFLPDAHGQTTLNEGRIVAPFINRAFIWGLSPYSLEDLIKKNSIKILTYSRPCTTYKLTEYWASKVFQSNFEIIEIESNSKSLGTSILKYVPKWRENFDIIILTEPEISWFRDKNDKLNIDIHHELYGDDPFAFTSILSTASYLKTNQEVTKRLLKAFRFAYHILNHNCKHSDLNDPLTSKAISAAYTISASVYPPNNMPSENVVRNMFFKYRELNAYPSSILIDRKEQVSLIRAYNLHYPHTDQCAAIIENAIYNTVDELKLFI